MGGLQLAPAALALGKNPVPIVLEPGWASRPIWTAQKMSPPPEFGRRTDRIKPSLTLSLSQYIIFLSLRYAQLSTIIILPSLTYAKNKGRRFGCRAEQPNYLYTKSFTESKVKIMIQPNDDPLVGSPSEVASSQHVISVRRHN